MQHTVGCTVVHLVYMFLSITVNRGGFGSMLQEPLYQHSNVLLNLCKEYLNQPTFGTPALLHQKSQTA